QTPTIEISPTLAAKSGVQVYNSLDYHVGFYYPTSGYTIKEEGNKIEIIPTDYPAAMQWVEILPKDPNNTLQQAITKDVLGSYNPSDCIFGLAETNQYQYASNVQTVSLNYNLNNIDQYGYVNDTSKCPVAYTNHSESRLYFLVDTKRPAKLLFFHLNATV